MSDRERWIIYPLLIFAICPTIKDVMVRPVELKSRTVECNQLVVKSFDGKRWFQIGGSYNNAGYLVLYGASEKPALVLQTDSQGKQGVIETMDGNGDQVTLLGANPGGGVLRLVGQEGQSSLVLGYNELGKSGLLAVDSQDKLMGFEIRERFVPWGIPLPALPDPEGGERPADQPAGDEASGGPPQDGTADGSGEETADPAEEDRE